MSHFAIQDLLQFATFRTFHASHFLNRTITRSVTSGPVCARLWLIHYLDIFLPEGEGEGGSRITTCRLLAFQHLESQFDSIRDSAAAEGGGEGVYTYWRDLCLLGLRLRASSASVTGSSEDRENYCPDFKRHRHRRSVAFRRPTTVATATEEEESESRSLFIAPSTMFEIGVSAVVGPEPVPGFDLEPEGMTDGLGLRRLRNGSCRPPMLHSDVLEYVGRIRHRRGPVDFVCLKELGDNCGSVGPSRRNESEMVVVTAGLGQEMHGGTVYTLRLGQQHDGESSDESEDCCVSSSGSDSEGDGFSRVSRFAQLMGLGDGIGFMGFDGSGFAHFLSGLTNRDELDSIFWEINHGVLESLMDERSRLIVEKQRAALAINQGFLETGKTWPTCRCWMGGGPTMRVRGEFVRFQCVGCCTQWNSDSLGVVSDVVSCDALASSNVGTRIAFVVRAGILRQKLVLVSYGGPLPSGIARMSLELSTRRVEFLDPSHVLCRPLPAHIVGSGVDASDQPVVVAAIAYFSSYPTPSLSVVWSLRVLFPSSSPLGYITQLAVDEVKKRRAVAVAGTEISSLLFFHLPDVEDLILVASEESHPDEDLFVSRPSVTERRLVLESIPSLELNGKVCGVVLREDSIYIQVRGVSDSILVVSHLQQCVLRSFPVPLPRNLRSVRSLSIRRVSALIEVKDHLFLLSLVDRDMIGVFDAQFGAFLGKFHAGTRHPIRVIVATVCANGDVVLATASEKVVRLWMLNLL